MANWGWGTLVDLLKLGAGVALTATGVGAAAGAPMTAAALGGIATGAGIGLSGASGLADDASAPTDDELAKAQRPKMAYTPPPREERYGPNPMERYAPENRRPQSGVDPEIMNYLMKYMRPR